MYLGLLLILECLLILSLFGFICKVKIYKVRSSVFLGEKNKMSVIWARVGIVSITSACMETSLR